MTCFKGITVSFNLTQRRDIRVFVLLVFAILLNACSTISPKPLPLNQLKRSAQQHIYHQQLKRLSITHWQLSGALSLHTNKDGISLFMKWQQDDQQHATLRFIGPVNTGSALLTIAPKKVSLSTSKGEHYQAKSADKLLAHAMGWQLPVGHLFYWIRGLAAPDTSSTRRYAPDGTLENIKQDGWQISYRRFKHYSNNINLPSKLILTRTQPNLTVKIIINDWRLHNVLSN